MKHQAIDLSFFTMNKTNITLSSPIPNLQLLVAIMLLLSLSFSANSQGKKKEGKKKEKGLLVSDFFPSDSSKVVKLPKVRFENINVIPDYYDATKLAQIKRFKKNKQWDEFMVSLYMYVSKFGINNFIKDMNLIWELARVAEYKGETELTKDLYRLIIKHYRGDLQEALTHYDTITKFERPLYADIEDYYKLVEKRRLIDTLQPPVSILLDMGEGVNSLYDDYGITLAGENDNIVVFTSSRNQDTSKYFADLMGIHEMENIYISEKDDADEWSPAKPFTEMNSQYKEGSPCMSTDGKTFVFARCLSPEGYGDCDLYISHKNEKGEWSPPQNLGEGINSYAWDSHPAFSISEDTLFFASNRRGGFGGSDLYYSVKNSKTGQWGKAMNMGPVINTRDSEVSPFPHPEFNVLYFSSNGQILNFGDFDIFKSYSVDGGWTEPKNVGPLVNGAGSELYFTIDTDSKYLFYAKSAFDNGRNLDLMSFPLPMEAKPNNTVRFSGRLIEPATGEVFKGVVSVIDLDEGVEVSPKILREDGTFEFELIDKRKYLLIIEGDNFFRIEEMFDMEGDLEMEVVAQRIQKVFTFESIDFERNSSRLKPEMENNLHLVIDFLVAHPDYSLKVTGHTDSDGDEEINMRLSQERADVIKKYIIDYGRMSDNRIIAEGKGSSMPIIEEELTEADKSMNRRVEFELFNPDAK
ncbi:OmpA family protein [Flammeovirgaceae bacterium SG7u.111]|nr:OmpA family protein [Flammeovirgaceae bacterium SG7u.132]WPO38546.1 OmpA family protein [Flammeovirgaceae bacterium SG7u.111]